MTIAALLHIDQATCLHAALEYCTRLESYWFLCCVGMMVLLSGSVKRSCDVVHVEALPQIRRNHQNRELYLYKSI